MSRAPLPLIGVTSVLFLIALVGCGEPTGGGGAASVDGAANPTALTERASVLAKAEDFGGMVGLFVPDERPLISFGLIMMAQMAPMMSAGSSGAGGDAAEASMKARLEAFQQAMDATLGKHGLPDIGKSPPPSEAMMNQVAAGAWLAETAPNLDHGALAADIFEALSELGDEAAAEASEKLRSLGGEITDLEIDGDRAAAKVGGNSTAFRKVAGRWYFSIIDELEAGGMGTDGPPSDGPPSDGPGR